jgi:hypothetical protein
MSYIQHIRGECEAFRLLRALVSDPSNASTLSSARRFLDSFRVQKNMRPVGRPLGAVTLAQLRQIAELDAAGNHSQKEIGSLVGVARTNVAHHLKPSKAMLFALLETAA